MGPLRRRALHLDADSVAWSLDALFSGHYQEVVLWLKGAEFDFTSVRKMDDLYNVDFFRQRDRDIFER